MLSYIYSWLYPEPPKKTLISETDLLQVKLKPINIPARNISDMDKSKFQSLGKVQLEDILAVNLKKTDINPKQTYAPRHPVLREILKYNQ